MNFLFTLALLVSANQGIPVGETVSDFALDDFRGKKHTLSDFKDQPIIVLAFLGTECPLAKLYGPRLQRLQDQYADRGVVFWGVNSNTQDSLSEIAAFARKHDINFPMLKDPGNRLADQLRAKRTPEVFVLDDKRVLRYWGRIDNQFGVGYLREEPTEHQLKDAIDALLAGHAIEAPKVESVGCYIGRVREPSVENTGETEVVTYRNQIAKIMQENCIECHRDGEIAPFTLTNYEDVSAWAETIAEVVREQRMPPWHANPAHGDFLNARILSDEVKQQIDDWVAAGAPEGEGGSLPEPAKYTPGWHLPRAPDEVFGMSSTPFQVAAENTVEYQYFVVDPKFKEDKWISAAEVIPGNRSVVHHAIVFIRPPGQPSREQMAWLTAYVPGQATMVLPAGQGVLVPAGSKFVFQMHYTPIGTEQKDLTKVGLIYAEPESIQEQVLTLIAMNREFEIPAGVADFKARAWLDQVPQDAKLLAIAPHMHLRGKSFKFVLHAADDSDQETLLDVPNYDFNWQHSYQLTAPISLEKGMTVECIAEFDNSEDNPTNPDPTVSVRWGDQTWQEMVVAYFGIAIPHQPSSAKSVEDDSGTNEKYSESVKAAERMMKRWDSNRDGLVTRREVPKAFAVFAFAEFDQDGDERISFEEARKQAFRTRKTNSQ
ncbi:MAG: redoxin domain-containing protein [Planctomycetaceae bacterium]|nr:redoxin domain-containing protein [Planctomycetaceae bacterium]